MSGHRALRGAASGLAAGGVLLGHWLTYRLVSPHDQAREALLAGTGHGYLAVVDDLGQMLAVGALAAVVLGRLLDPSGPPADLRRWIGRLAFLPVGAFAGMEVLERLSSGTPLGDLLQHGLLPAGVAIQLALAGVAALLVRWLLGVTGRLREALGRAAPLPRPAHILRRPTAPASPAVGTLLISAGIRGPPHPR